MRRLGLLRAGSHSLRTLWPSVRHYSTPPLRSLSPQELPSHHFDVVIVGGGHAGCEAAAASVATGAKTLLITQKISTIGAMSCNPSIGGVGKGHLVREIDALGGVMGQVADQAGIHFRMLNESKGPAVWGPRAQEDRVLYRQAMQEALASLSGGENPLHCLEASVEDITVSHLPSGRATITHIDVIAAECEDRLTIPVGAVVLATGTFLRAQICHGPTWRENAGRMGDAPSIGLANTLERLLSRPLRRLKTGTPPRIQWPGLSSFQTAMQQHPNEVRQQLPEADPRPFSFIHEEVEGGMMVWNRAAREGQAHLPCFLTHTTPATHQLIESCAGEGPYFTSGTDGIGKGPRYCPSLELKVVRFPTRQAHLD